MPELHLDCAVETLIESLDTMAFIAGEPVCGDIPCPPDPLHVQMAYGGSQSGRVELIAPRSFARMLAANVLGTDPDDPQARERADDALRELVNVTVGAMMPKLASSLEDRFTLGLPQLSDFDPSQWLQALSDGRWTILDGDGHILALAHRRD